MSNWNTVEKNTLRASEETVRVKEIMSRKPVFVETNRSVDAAYGMTQRHGVHYLIVADAEGDLVGVTCACDLRRASGDSRVAFVTHKPAVFVIADEPVDEAARIMQRCAVGCLPVANAEGVIEGIVTRHDLRESGAWQGPDARPRCAGCGTSHNIHCVPRAEVVLCDDCRQAETPLVAVQESFPWRERDTL